jgi:ubiquinone/menaquinone biosynthesis C-methylase UbiE
MYRDTSRDLARLAEVHGDQVVVDLACGTGVTTGEVLAALGPGGEVFALDSSPAMLGEARGALDDPRVHWIAAAAEEVADAVEAADVVVCNSAIWQTDMPAVFSAVRGILRPGGRFTFNIGRLFLMPFTDGESESGGPSLVELMQAFAVIDHAWTARTQTRRRRHLTVDSVDQFLPGLDHDAQRDVAEKAWARFNRTELDDARWVAFLAEPARRARSGTTDAPVTQYSRSRSSGAGRLRSDATYGDGDAEQAGGIHGAGGPVRARRQR